MAHKTFVTVMKTDNMTYYSGRHRNQLIAWDGEGKAYVLAPKHSHKEEDNEYVQGIRVEHTISGVEWQRVEELDHPEAS